MNTIKGRRDRLEDTIHERYGFAADHMRKEMIGSVGKAEIGRLDCTDI